MQAPPTISRAAVSSLVLGILGFAIVTALAAIILGIVAVSAISGGYHRGKDLAVAGIVCAAGWLALIAVLVAAGAIGGPGARPSAEPSAGSSNQQVFAASLAAGDCFDIPAQTPGQQGVNTVTQTSCTAPHNAQVFATFKVSGSHFNYPGAAQLVGLATSGCRARINSSMDTAKLTTSMILRVLYPLDSEWLAGNQTIRCFAYNPTPTLTSSLLKS